jgi:hypothetical protein
VVVEAGGEAGAVVGAAIVSILRLTAHLAQRALVGTVVVRMREWVHLLLQQGKGARAWALAVRMWVGEGAVVGVVVVVGAVVVQLKVPEGLWRRMRGVALHVRPALVQGLM